MCSLQDLANLLMDGSFKRDITARVRAVLDANPLYHVNTTIYCGKYGEETTILLEALRAKHDYLVFELLKRPGINVNLYAKAHKILTLFPSVHIVYRLILSGLQDIASHFDDLDKSVAASLKSSPLIGRYLPNSSAKPSKRSRRAKRGKKSSKSAPDCKVHDTKDVSCVQSLEHYSFQLY